MDATPQRGELQSTGLNGIKKKKSDNQVYEFEKSNATRFTETNWYCDRVLLWDYQEKVIVKKSKWTGF